MNTLIKIKEGTSSGAAIQTMSSIEIAEVCGKKHKNVMRDIKQIFNELKFEPVDHMCASLQSTCKTLACYNRSNS
ncbi:Rha family transcriptional regulator, partial [Bartonella henselae]|uniref:Rha family transcriptional regulator n=1 Tax=Bartonella henselae TaxID=38323 RepID=UPI000AD723B7